MLNVLIIIIAIFFSVIGLSELLHRLWLYLLRPKSAPNFIVTLLDGEYAAEQVTATLEDMRWNGRKSACMLIGVDCGLPDNKLAACKMIERTNDDFIIVTPEYLSDEIIKRS